MGASERKIAALEREVQSLQQTLWLVLWAQPDHRIEITHAARDERPAHAIISHYKPVDRDSTVLVAQEGGEG
jgi:hypothetical protein